ncbi:hypothetical protein EVAR_4856_1 [Eumeta japonica]|uniref:Uncharacterized protein n=1 Tax=Eumeta variegata TaxID=151549 RepID=A0A4C1SZ75_EUMVA|nr:hypothetical protein EVAR_4856_1 [Eumeta japonica]
MFSHLNILARSDDDEHRGRACSALSRCRNLQLSKAGERGRAFVINDSAVSLSTRCTSDVHSTYLVGRTSPAGAGRGSSPGGRRAARARELTTAERHGRRDTHRRRAPPSGAEPRHTTRSLRGPARRELGAPAPRRRPPPPPSHELFSAKLPPHVSLR